MNSHINLYQIIVLSYLRAPVCLAHDFCEDWKLNNNRFDFGRDDFIDNQLVRKAFIGSHSYELFYDSKTSRIALKNSTVVQLRDKYALSFTFQRDNKGLWTAYYKDDKDVIDLEKIGSTQRDETFNIWFKKMIFKPSVVFGSLGPELRPTYRFVIALQQKLVNGVYERVTKTYDWEERRREFRDCTDQQSRDIPLFISILNTTLHINAIFPFYDHNKYAVIFGGHPSGPRACLATTNLTDSLECSPDNLYFVINCDITYRTANTVLMIVVISLVIVFLCVVFLMFGVWFSCRNGKTDNINITQLKNTETASMASVSTINSNTGEQVSHTGSPNLRSKSITDRKCKASKKV